MVDEVDEILTYKMDMVDYFIKLPDVFDDLRGKDAKFEMVISSTISPMRLFCTENIVTDYKAVIFVNTGIDKLKNQDHKKMLE